MNTPLQTCSDWDESESRKDYSDCEDRLHKTWGCPRQPSEIKHPTRSDIWWAEKEVATGPIKEGSDWWKYDICCTKENTEEQELMKKLGYCDPAKCEFNEGAHLCIQSPQMFCREKNSQKLLLVSNQCCYRNHVYYVTETGRTRRCTFLRRFLSWFSFGFFKACKLLPWSKTTRHVDNSLITSGVGSGSMLTQMASLYNIVSYYYVNLLPYEACTTSSTGLEVFKKHRPTITGHFKPRQSVMPVGDPSVPTLDGLRYPFMGVGVYTLLQSYLEDSTVIQTSMRRLGNGTVFSGLALFYPNHSLECYINSGGEFSYALNGYKMTLDGPKQFILHGFSINRNTNNKHFTFELLENNLKLQVIITDNYLNFVITPPDEFRANMDGLLGHFDGDSSNDFTAKGKYLTIFANQFVIFTVRRNNCCSY